MLGSVIRDSARAAEVTLLDYHRLYAAEKRALDREKLEPELGAETAAAIRAMLPREGDRFEGDLADVQTGELFERMGRLCARYRDGSAAERDYIRAMVDRRAAQCIESFALRSAVLGARRRSADDIELALMGFIVAGLEGGDVRDSLIGISLVFDCARKSGADPFVIFRAAAAKAPPSMSAVLTDFADRPPDLQSIACMGWREVETPDGTGYSHGR